MVPKELVDARETYQAAVASTGPLLRARRRDDVFAVESAESVVEALLEQLEVSDALLVPLLSTLTGGGSNPAAETIGPCVLSLRIAIELEYPRTEVSRLGLAALAHEIGRARVQRESDASTVRRAVEDQVQLVRQCGPAYADVADLVRRTHDTLSEAAPGSELPRTLGEAAHVIGLATIYHGLAHQRGTEHAWPPARLKAILRAERARFPDRILKSLIRVLTTLPLGGLVRLNNGELGYVVAKNAGFPLRPVVAVWISLGKLLTEPKLVDLQRDPFLYVEAFLGDTRLDADRGGLGS
jgi:hypothetical protein